MIKISSYEKKVGIVLLILSFVLCLLNLYLNHRDAVDIKVDKGEKALTMP